MGHLDVRCRKNFQDTLTRTYIDWQTDYVVMIRRSPMIEKKKKRYENERKGFRIHALVTFAVMALLAFINLTFVPEFYWFLFPAFGMSIGLTTHYMFGARRKNFEKPVY